MNQYENKYESNLESINNTLKKLDTTIKDLVNKSSEVRLKIEMLMKKVNLKLVDSTQLLQFQHTILINEINYLKNLKQILLSNINTQLYCLSENIAMMAMSVLNVYKDIPGNDIKHILITNKNEEFPKITADISFNLNYVHDILENFKKYNDELFAELINGNFHAKTLKNDMGNVYSHINLEYLKYVDDMDKRMEYYVEFSKKISDQLDNMKIADFYN
jgi:hypothetical protein